MLDQIQAEIDNLMNSGGPNEAIDFTRKVINNCILNLSGLYQYKGDAESSIKILNAGLFYATDCYMYSNLAVLLIAVDKFDTAFKILEYAIKTYPPDAKVYFNYGVVLKYLRRLEESVAAFDKSLELEPKQPQARCQLAHVCAALGQFERFFDEYWYRFAAYPELKKILDSYNKPFWDGSTGGRILVFNEQGNGDLINFARYIKLLKEKADATVILEVKPDMYDLFKSLEGVDELVTTGTKVNCDFVVPVLSLPYYFDADLNNIPIADSYLKPSGLPLLLFVKDAYVKQKPKIGICWAGVKSHTNDRDRSCYLKHFKPLFDLDVDIYSLHIGDNERAWQTTKVNKIVLDGSEEVDVVNLLEGTEDFKYTNLTKDLTDYNATAHIINQLDLVISVDTSVAHLAGALGKPVWLLLPAAHEWRWQKTWYPSMRVFKQPQVGNWEDLLKEVAEEVRKQYVQQ